jgi:beta-lactamase superfamily II metal-dependent hydrolase
MRAIVAGALVLAAATAARAERGVEIYWVDVEGGGATLIVTPARESVLIDTGFAGDRDARRIQRVATQAAGLSRIDHVIVTHFHRDHFGGLADLARLLPVGTLHERYLASAPEGERAQPELEPYKTVAVERRSLVKAGDRLALKQAPGTASVRLDILGASSQFVAPRRAADNPACRGQTPKDPDPSDNKNSVVSLLTFGPFRFFDGGDLTWAAEASLVCPQDRVGGTVDLYQTDHHASDSSNNPVLLRTLRPTVVVVNNGPRKGGEAGTLAALGAMKSTSAVYQMHRSLRVPEGNTSADRIANEEEDCAGHFIKRSVDPRGRSYTVWVPSTGHRQTYATKAQ